MSMQHSFAQKDSIIVSEGIKDSIDLKYDRIYKLFLQDKSHDVRHLWKVNLLQSSFVLLNLTYEQKIGKKWTNETYLGVNPYFDFYHDYKDCKVRLEDRIKYYYNLGRRERLGKNTIGFSGNYFAIGGLLKGDRKSFSPEYYSQRLEYITLLYYGLQRRIGNIAYFETYIGVGYPINIQNAPQDWQYWDMGVRLGFAIESVAELKRMLR